MTSGKPHCLETCTADPVLWSGGLAPTSCMMSQTVHHCLCISHCGTKPDNDSWHAIYFFNRAQIFH